MEATAQTFWKWAGELEGKFSGNKNQKHFVWALPAAFFAMR